MTTLWTSDTHFGHVNIIEYCKRPFGGVDHMTTELTRRWNSVVKDSDTVYHLGDFALGPKWKWADYRKELNGQIIFVVGNHDLLDPHKFATPTPHPQFLDMLAPGDTWETDAVMPLDGVSGLLLMSHVPPTHVYNDGRTMMKEITHSDTLWAGPENDVLLCGHIHDAWRENKEHRIINVGVDVWDYTPQPLETLLKVLV